MPNSYIYNETDNKYYQKLVAYGDPIETNVTVDLNNEWVSDTEDDEYRYFKSNSNFRFDDYDYSYSQCKVTWSNLASITFKYMSSSQINYDYLCVGKLDGEKFTAVPNDGSSNVYLSTKGKTSGTYYEFTIECDEGEHHIWFCYRKDEENYEGEDRGFIGVPKSALSVLGVKQGSELPMEREYGGISAEGGKTYDIYVNNVTVPNGNIVTDYKNVEKTEKAINTEYVDLGLSVKWATCNIGAETETEGGVFFQWGDISGVSGSLVGKYSDENYTWASYTHCNGSNTTLTKYNNDTSYGENPDNITTLETVDDAATQIMGGDWRMPTKAEFDELLSGTTNEWFADYNGTGVSGRKFTSKTDTSKYIFIPAAGSCYNDSVIRVGNNGNVWTSSLNTYDPRNAWYLSSYSGGNNKYNSDRCFGFSVRGVRA